MDYHLYSMNGSTLNQGPTTLQPHYDISSAYHTRHNDFGGQVYDSKLLHSSPGAPHDHGRFSHIWNISSFHSNYSFSNQIPITKKNITSERGDNFSVQGRSDVSGQYSKWCAYPGSENDRYNYSENGDFNRRYLDTSYEHSGGVQIKETTAIREHEVQDEGTSADIVS